MYQTGQTRNASRSLPMQKDTLVDYIDYRVNLSKPTHKHSPAATLARNRDAMCAYIVPNAVQFNELQHSTSPTNAMGAYVALAFLLASRLLLRRSQHGLGI